MEKADLTPIIAHFNDFFTSIYKKKIDKLLLVYPKKKSLEVDYEDLEKFDPDIADKLIKEPDMVIEAAEKAVEEMNLTLPSGEHRFTPHVRIENVPSSGQLIEQLNSRNINELVAFKGVITKRAEVMNRVKIAVYRCQICDSTLRLPVVKNFTPPKRCDSCKKLALKQVDEESDFVDIQRAEVQELLERVSGGAPAARIELLFEDDLVNRANPGENVELIGMLRLRPPMKSRQKQELVYARYLEVNNIKSLKRDFEEIEIEKEDEKRIKELAADPNIEKVMVDSVAPSIYGHEEVKRAIALQLFGGTKGKAMKGGAPLRDDIHILLIGDPGLAKSRMMQNCQEIAPKSIYVSGKTTSGVGLCVSGDSLITLNDAGVVSIGDFIEKNFSNGSEEIEGAYSSRFDSNVTSLNEILRSENRHSPKIWKIKPPKRMINLHTQRGKEVKITPNTQLISIKEGKPTWTKPTDIEKGDIVATTRSMPALEGKRIPIINLIENNNARVVSKQFIELTDLLAKKYGSLTDVADRYGFERERLYSNRSKKQGILLTFLKKMIKDAGANPSGFSIDSIFLRYGQEHKLPQMLDPEICYLAGLIAGDGDIHLKDSTGFVRFHSDDEQLLEDFRRIVQTKFGIEAKTKNDGKRIVNAIASSLILAEVLTKLGVPAGKKSHRIDISTLLTSSGKDNVKAYMQGLFDTDGWAYHGKKCSSSVGICTVSKKLAQKILLLLEWWGVNAKLRIRKDKMGKKSVIRGKEVISRKQQYYVEIRGIDNLIKFKSGIGFKLKSKKKRLDTIIKESNKAGNPNSDIVPIMQYLKELRKRYKLPINKIGDVFFRRSNPSRKKIQEIIQYLPECKDRDLLNILANSDIYWDRVSEKKEFKPKDEWVYDLTVNGSHNFIANGIIVHNTVSAERDELGDGGWTLKAGALVLASGGMAMIDEFDKIEEEDRAALHEAMESAQISIAKAGMVAKFRTKTAILAAANPKWGRFDLNKNLADQFHISPTLLTRFDLIFPIVDVLDEEKDTRLASHILQTHMGQDVGGEYERLVDRDLLRKYIAYARRNVKPKLTKAASDKIKEFYVELRRKGKDTGSVTITPRYLEGLVRLAEANAKMRLCETVEERDADTAIGLLKHVMRQVMTDKETGAFDVDVIATGKPKSEREKLQKADTIIEIIREHLKSEDSADLEKVISDAASYDIDGNTAKRIISELLRKGHIYEKEHGYVRIVGE